jgi:hypothetical protein
MTTEIVSENFDQEVVSENAAAINNSPPLLFKRDDNGLLTHIQYKFTKDGFVDWRAMVPVEYLYINPERKAMVEKKYGKPIEQLSIVDDKVDDGFLVISLAGLKYLARLRGYNNVYSSVNKSQNEEFVDANCNVDWIGNYETLGMTVSFGASACATRENTNQMGRRYLVETAENRAFCRAVRNFLNINIVAKEELGGKSSDDDFSETLKNPTPANLVKQRMEENARALNDPNYNFAFLKAALIKKGNKDAARYNDYTDLPAPLCFEILAGFSRKEENAKNSKKV